MKKPVFDMTVCIKCEICCDLCPEVFELNDLGFLEVKELPDYSQYEELIDEAIKTCPPDCISWEEE